MRFLNPKTDFAFKKIFGSAQSTDILLSFLNALLGLKSPYQLVDIQILDPYLAPKIKGMKDTYLDVRAKDEQGRSYLIEIQVLNVAGFEKRILYNACKAYAGQIQKGEDYRLLTDVIAITITDFMMFKELSGIINTFKLAAESGHVFSDELELLFAELPKFTLEESELTSTLDRWFYFLKYASDLTVIPKSFEADPAIVHAFEIANKASLSAEELDDQERREMFIQDQRGVIELALDRGFDKGRKEGQEEGDHDARVSIATALFDIIDDDTVIAEKTGLSVKQIQMLRHEHQGSTST